MTKDSVDTALEKQLDYLKLAYCKENFRPLAAEGHAECSSPKKTDTEICGFFSVIG